MKKARLSVTINQKDGEKMTGFLVINHFLNGKKFNELHSHLVESAKKHNIDLQIKTNLDMIFNEDKCDFVLFWDKDVALAKSLENKGIPVFNSSSAIELCDDKGKTYLALNGTVPQPKTYIAPLSFFDADYAPFLHKCVEKIGTPFVLKECKGSFGEQVYLCNNISDALSHLTGTPFLVQEYIECDNTDIRIEVVGGKAVAAMKRHNPTDFRSNITNGGTATPYTPCENEIALATKACSVLGLDFGGVDIINGMVCEVNSNAHIINIMNTTGIDIADKIFDYILEKI